MKHNSIQLNDTGTNGAHFNNKTNNLPSITTLSINCHFTARHCAQCHVFLLCCVTLCFKVLCWVSCFYYALWHYSARHYAECHIFVMLSDVMMRVIMLTVMFFVMLWHCFARQYAECRVFVMLSNIMLLVIMLSDIMLDVIMLSVMILSC
jgi:hypothetical protein